MYHTYMVYDDIIYDIIGGLIQNQSGHMCLLIGHRCEEQFGNDVKNTPIY